VPEDTGARAPRQKRFDARRNVESLLDAAKTVFATSGVDAPAKEITDRAGVGVGTLYRHFPQRADLIKAVIEREIDVCAAAAATLAAEHEPADALARWLDRLAAFVATKRGFAAALHSGDPTFDGLSGFFMAKLGPSLDSLLGAAATAGQIRDDITAQDLLYAVAKLCAPRPDELPDYGRRMVAVLVDGLRRR
jgi:AcrR family transcriptional regulator